MHLRFLAAQPYYDSRRSPTPSPNVASSRASASRATGSTWLTGGSSFASQSCPSSLVQTWRPLWDPELKAEGAKRVTWEIADIGEEIATLTVTHELEGAPKTAVGVAGAGEGAAGAGGWPWVLSDLKTLLETGKSMSR